MKIFPNSKALGHISHYSTHDSISLLPAPDIHEFRSGVKGRHAWPILISYKL